MVQKLSLILNVDNISANIPAKHQFKWLVFNQYIILQAILLFYIPMVKSPSNGAKKYKSTYILLLLFFLFIFHFS